MTLHCNVTAAVPKPTITWKNLGDSSLVYPSGQNLTLNVSRKDSGQFSCVADNGIKPPATSLIAILDVHCKSVVIVSGYEWNLRKLIIDSGADPDRFTPFFGKRSDFWNFKIPAVVRQSI